MAETVGGETENLDEALGALRPTMRIQALKRIHLRHRQLNYVTPDLTLRLCDQQEGPSIEDSAQRFSNRDIEQSDDLYENLFED